MGSIVDLFSYTYAIPIVVDSEHSLRHQWKVRSQQISDMHAWCSENIEHWGYSNYQFYFSYEQDYNWFLLKWL